jgi:hypothetical protein
MTPEKATEWEREVYEFLRRKRQERFEGSRN